LTADEIIQRPDGSWAPARLARDEAQYPQYESNSDDREMPVEELLDVLLEHPARPGCAMG
jgi:hypothetical protein